MNTAPGNKNLILSFTVKNKKIAEFYNRKGVEKADEGNLVEALSYFNKAIQADPTCIEALFNRATIKADLGEFAEARKDFTKIIALNSSASGNNSDKNAGIDQNTKINFF